MARILVSIISQHLLPNYLFFKQHQDMFEGQIFVTTKKMIELGIGQNLEIAMGIPESSVPCIEVSNDNYSEILQKLQKSDIISADDEYWVNQTGGTKAMSLAVFSFFSKYTAHFVYVPIGTNDFIDMMDDSKKYPIDYRLSLKEYMHLYGMTYKSSSDITFNTKLPFEIFDEIKKKNYRIPNKYIKAEEHFEDPKEKVFYKGAWFEEYSYLRIKRDFNLRDDQIALSAKIFRKGSLLNDNEIDVLFIKDNVLHVVECKVSMIGAQNTPKKTIEEYLYKLAAISKDLGLQVNSYLFTMHKMNTLSEKSLENIAKRVRILGIKGIFDGECLKRMPLKLEKDCLLRILKPKGIESQETLKKSETPNPKRAESKEPQKPKEKSKKEADNFLATVVPKIELKPLGKIDLSQLRNK